MTDTAAEPATHRLAMNGKDSTLLRGDSIDAERYFSADFMSREWDHLWTKIWHIAGRVQQLVDAGDYVVHHFMHESVVIVRQADGSLRGFYNTCGHRAQRLVWQDGSQDSLTCPYHGWVWGLDGTLVDLPDRDDFPQGDPCGELTLVEVRVAVWGSLVWYTMDPEAPELLDYLEPVPELYGNYQLDKTIRVRWMRIALDCNWKFSSDNFNESYHTRTVHPQVPPIIDQDHFTSRFEMYPMGHARIVQLGRPSLRDQVPEGKHHRWDDQLRDWGIDPDSYPDYETKAVQGWLDLKAAKRRLWRVRGFLHYEHLTDEELTESPFQTIFPNIAIGPSADGFSVYRWEPHPSDPEKCFFDLWTMAYPVAGQAEYVKRTAKMPVKLEEAEYDERDYDDGLGVADLADQVVFQDWQLTAGQRAGWRSRGYQEPYLAAQETRVRRFHEVLNDYLAGNPPGALSPMSFSDHVTEIIMLTHRYARVDRYDPEALLGVFTEDAVLDHSAYGLARCVGHEEIAAYFARSRASGRQSMHMITNHVVEVTGERTAVGSNYVQAFRPDPDGGQPLTAALALNADRYALAGAGWRISHRVTSPAIDIGFEF